MRLDRLLANSGYGTRSEVRKLILKGLVTVDGQVVKDIGFNASESSEISIGNSQIETSSNLYFKLNKPDCVLTAMEDKRLKTVALSALFSLVVIPSFGQDLLANQAPVDRKMKAVDTLMLQQLIQNEVWEASPAADLYDSWENGE